ncbi:MAG: ATP-binding cassette domain-containing protein [Eggerthella lenta]
MLHDQIAAILARGKTVIVAEHRLYFVADLIDRAVLIEERVARGSRPRTCALSGGRARLRPARSRPRRRDGRDVPAAACATVRSSANCAARFRQPAQEATRVRPGQLRRPRGAVVGVTGANGVGKSTLVRAMAALERATRSCASTAHRSMPARAAAGARSSCRT